MADITNPPRISTPDVASPYGLWAHPHIHALLMVPAGYWRRGYIRQTGWQNLWAAALGLDYAGVDLMPTAAGPVVIEVNGIAAWQGLQRVTGFNIAQALVDDLLGRRLQRPAVQQGQGW